MSEKIYISPSSQPANTYAVGNTNEQEQCRRIGAALNDALKRCGFEVKAGMDGTMYTRTRESNAWGADLHVPIHTNAFNGQLRGTRMFCSSTTGEGGKACKAILAVLAPLVPGESDNVQSANYYEITATKAPCAYVEAAFHDHKEQAQWIIDHIVGNGESDDARSNAHTLDWDGNAWFAGDVYVGSTSGTNKDEGSKKLIPAPADATAGDLLMYDGTNWVKLSKADLIAEIIAALPSAE